MWDINYQTLIMAVSDQIRHKTKEETGEPVEPGTATVKATPDQDNSALAFFQSQVNS